MTVAHLFFCVSQWGKKTKAELVLELASYIRHKGECLSVLAKLHINAQLYVSPSLVNWTSCTSWQLWPHSRSFVPFDAKSCSFGGINKTCISVYPNCGFFQVNFPIVLMLNEITWLCFYPFTFLPFLLLPSHRKSTWPEFDFLILCEQPRAFGHFHMLYDLDIECWIQRQPQCWYWPRWGVTMFTPTNGDTNNWRSWHTRHKNKNNVSLSLSLTLL